MTLASAVASCFVVVIVGDLICHIIKKVFGLKTWMLPISTWQISRELMVRQPRCCYYSNMTHIFARVDFLFDFETCCAEDIGQYLNMANFDLWKDGGKD